MFGNARAITLIQLSQILCIYYVMDFILLLLQLSHVWACGECVWPFFFSSSFSKMAGEMLWYTQNYLFTQLFHGSRRWTLFLYIYVRLERKEEKNTHTNNKTQGKFIMNRIVRFVYFEKKKEDSVSVSIAYAHIKYIADSKNVKQKPWRRRSRSSNKKAVRMRRKRARSEHIMDGNHIKIAFECNTHKPNYRLMVY